MYGEEGEIVQGVLPLDSGLRDYCIEHIGILLGLTESNGVDISHIPSEEIQNQFLVIIGRLLENVITNSASITHSGILIKCLDLLDKSCEVSNLLTTHFSEQLTLLLIQDKYPDFRSPICRLLINSDYEFTEEEAVELNKLVISSHSTELLKLLTNKEVISIVSLTYIINATGMIQENDPSYDIYKDQMLLIIENLKKDSKLCGLLSPQLLDVFKLSQDKNLILPIGKLISDRGGFETYFDEIKINLESLANSLEINYLRTEVRNQPDNPDLMVHLQKLSESTIKSRDKTDKSVLDDQLQHKNLQECFERIITTYNSITKLLENKIPISEELVDLHDKFLIEILHNDFLAHQSELTTEYQTLLEKSYECCFDLLFAQYNLSEKLVESLINKVGNDLAINLILSGILTELAKQNKLPVVLVGSSIEILKKNINSPDFVTIIAHAFKYFAWSGIEDDSFTAELCVQILSDEVAHEEKKIILSGLEAIVTNSSKLQGDVITALIKMIIDPEQLIEHRTRAIKLLLKIPESLSEENVSNLSVLLEGEEKFILSDIDSTRRFFSAGRYDYDNEYRDPESLQTGIFKRITKEVSDLDLNRNAFNQKDNQNYYYQATDIRLIQNEIMRHLSGNFTIHTPIGDGRYANQALSALVLSLDEHKPTLCIYNLGDWHWVSFAALKINDEVYVLYKDSKGIVNEKLERLIKEIDESARFITNTSCEQSLGVECGIFALKNMVIMAEQIQNNREDFIKRFEEFEGFCGLELARKLRAVDFSEEYVLGKYREINASELHLRSLLQLRAHHSSEAKAIEQKLKEEEALGEFSIRLLEADQEVAKTVSTITVEIATMENTDPTNSNYVYGYRFSISDNLTPHHEEIFTIISRILEAYPSVTGNRSIIFSADHVSSIVKAPKAAINDQSITLIEIGNLSENLSIESDSEEEKAVLRIIEDKIGVTLERHISSQKNTKHSALIQQGFISSEIQEPEQFDYKLAVSVAELCVNYAEVHGILPSGIIDKLARSIKEGNTSLSAPGLKALSIIAKKSPSLLNEELLEYLKVYDLETDRQIAFNTSLELLTGLLGESKEEVSKPELIKEELDKIAELLRVSRLQNINKLYDLLGKVIIVVPDLFNECLGLVKLTPFAWKNITIIDRLLGSGQLTNHDICQFITCGYNTVKLFTALEQYFNDNFISLVEDTSSLGEVVTALNSLVATGGKLKEETIDKLIELAKVNPVQAINISKILFTAYADLTNNQFLLIEELFKGAGLQLAFLLAKLFAKAHKQLTTASAVAEVFKELNASIPLNILPTEKLRAEANALLALKSRNSGLDKLAIIKSLQGSRLQTETIKTVAALVKHKSLSKDCIMILASQDHIPVLEEEISEIICKSKDELPDEYLKLKSFLSIDADSFLLNQEQLKVKEIIEQRFAEIYITDYGIEKIMQILEQLIYSQEFKDNMILGAILNKAESLEEWYVFLEFLIKNNISAVQLLEYLEQPSLTKIMDIIESKILSESLEELKALEHLNLEEIINQITYFCYQLKSHGWSVGGLAHILQKITGDNIHYFVISLRTIFEYRITEEQRNKKGECVFDIINTYSNDDLEPSIYLIANNQFEHKLENKGAFLLDKIIELNPELAEKQAEYLSILEGIRSIYIDSTKGEAICHWNPEQVKEWAIKFKEDHKNGGSKKQLDKKELVEIIAVLQRANNLHSAKGGKDGHLLRDTQIISLLLLLETEKNSKGKLLQVATGEGKSTISAMLAGILALYGYKIDLITSSKVLASIGQESAKGFFTMLGLKSGCNLKRRGAADRQNACYDYEIVYGDALTFQSDFLSNISNCGPKRGDRGFSISIVDEVDSMLIDSVNHVAKQATLTPLMEYVLPVMTMAWDNFHKIILPLNLETAVAIDETTRLINHLINSLPIPRHLEAYTKFQAKHWATSLVHAATQLQLDRDYVININNAGQKVINPVDCSTGVTHETMVWHNGLHQFLQIKHNCRISAETLTSFFITNIAYFLKYDRILGMTGTLGSEGSQEFLKTVYGLGIAFFPTYKDKQLIELVDRVENTKYKYTEAIVSSSYQEAVLHNRAVLVVCQTIKDAEELFLKIKQRCGNKAKVIKYLRSEESLYNNEIESIVLPNTIIVATNLAGRGTDIRTSPETEANGGLHVISTFIAKNTRDEEQVKGRTARQGNCGSYQIIALVRDYYDHESFGLTAQELIDNIRHNRDVREYKHIRYSIEHSIPDLLAQDDIYNKFSRFYLELLNIQDDPRIKNSKLKQLIEDFGLWLQINSGTTTIDQFLDTAKVKYRDDIFTNPSYIIMQQGLNVKRTWFGSIIKDPFSKVVAIDDIYTFAMHYYKAKSHLDSRNGNYKNRVVESLMATGHRVNEIISYLTAMNISVAGPGVNVGNELLKQITTKIDFFKSFTKHIESAIKIITNSGNREVRVKSYIDKKKLAPDLTPDDIEEIDFLGINEIFEVETYKPKRKWYHSLVVALCSIAQMAIGVFMAVSGNFGLGSKIFISGVMDAYKVGTALSKGRAVDLEEYISSKAIDYALIAVEVKFTEISKANAAKKGIEEGAKEVLKEGAKESIVKLAQTAGFHMAKTIAIEKIGELATKEVRENLLDGLEERVAVKVSKIAASVLEKNAMLLSPDYDLEHQLILRGIQNAIFKATQTHKHARVINDIASGIFKASSTSLHSEFRHIGQALYVAHKVLSMGDIISKIEPIIDDLTQEIENVVTRIAEIANAKTNLALLLGLSQTPSDSEQKSICDSLSRNIGSMVSDAILNLIQRKVTSPVISGVVGNLIDKSVENYQREQQVLMANHKYQLKHAKELEQKLPEKINPKQKAPGGKPKQPSSTAKPYDYSLLLGQKTDQELVQLNKDSLEYLTYFFDTSDKKTQAAINSQISVNSANTGDMMTIYNASRSTSQSSMFTSSWPQLSFISTAYANPAYGGAVMGIEISLESAAVAYGAVKLAGRAIPIVGTAGVAYSYVQSVTNYIINAPKGSYRPILANPVATSGMLMFENYEDSLEFTGVDDGNNYISIPQSEQTVLLTHINVNELPQLNPFARHSSNTFSSIILDQKYNRPSIESFPVYHQPKSILFTPDDRGHLLERSELPGFSPSMVKIWQEGFDVHKTDWKDSILEKRKHESSTKSQVSKFKDTTTFGMPDPGDLEPDDEFSHFKKKDGDKFYECEKTESPIWKDLESYKVIDGKQTRTNGLTGKNKKYYQWDNMHKEVEMYDWNGKPLDALDPITGKMKNKDVSKHQYLNIK